MLIWNLYLLHAGIIIQTQDDVMFDQSWFKASNKTKQKRLTTDTIWLLACKPSIVKANGRSFAALITMWNKLRGKIQASLRINGLGVSGVTVTGTLVKSSWSVELTQVYTPTKVGGHRKLGY